MDIRIEEIYSKRMFPGLMAGRPKDSQYEKSLKWIEGILGKDIPIFNRSKIGFKQIKETTDIEIGYVSYGHITGAKIR